ncbi:MAG: pyridoxal phosphate-dependent aminotransferase [Nitrososphaerota archaeon]|nr:pyridoxal phosphate-dependent aminotransferase [Nitrososphaerota archaeon]MDG6974594.1 pyridoxal phosphate-dependent aminotransferase [Nitrososphaerota archaeon]MDG7009396.1 pyridoxal phosphate-dependent aminotransferase [Nitrososphaerota archaeon]MDG7019184.1 pyridoxal phosphate-dependent aminotransferase [Nitrososphaerota archaeon]
MSELDRAESADGVISMWVADPAFPTDRRIVDAFNFAVDSGCTHYFPAKGFDELVLPKAIAAFYGEDRGLELDPADEVCITHGAQEALSLSIQAAMKPGDEMIVPQPTYNALIEKLEIFGVRPVLVPLLESEGWRLDTDAVRAAISERTRMVYVCNPNNPTGTVLGRKDVDALSGILREEERLSLLLDECYSRILFDGAGFAPFPSDDEELRGRTFLVNSFSKAYAMTGWRLGYVVTDKARADAIKRLSFELNGGVSYPIQYAGARALNDCASFVSSMVEELDRRRRAMIRGLSELEDVRFEPPSAGFEVFPDFSAYSRDSVALCARLLRDARVRTMPGVKYGPSGEGHLRLVFCAEGGERIEEGLTRIRGCLSRR